jgi:hypothetical protein
MIDNLAAMTTTGRADDHEGGSGTRAEDDRAHPIRRTGEVERAYYCRACNLTTRARNVPPGWYLLDRSAGGRGKHLRLGMYCSLSCLLDHTEELRAGEREHAGRLGLAADPERDRARLLERADTMLTAGLTLRQTAETLDIPPGALRTWLRAAGKPTHYTDTTTLAGGAEAGAGPAAAAVGAGGPPSPIAVLHQLRDAGHLLALAITVTGAGGPDHQPTFTAEARAETPATDQPRTSGVVTGRGTGPSKAAAKTAAAAVLLRQLTTPSWATRPPGQSAAAAPVASSPDQGALAGG